MTPEPDDLFAATHLDSPTAKLRAVPTAGAPLTAGPGPLPAELSNPAFEPVQMDDPTPLGFVVAEDDPTEILHLLACGCRNIDNTGPEHLGYDFRELGAAFEAKIRDKVLAEQQAALPAVQAARHALEVTAPIEAKVSAGAWGALAASMGVALGTAILQNLDVLPSLLGGRHPWAGGLVTVLGVALPPLIGLWRGYAAPHTPRCDVPGGAS